MTDRPDPERPVIAYERAKALAASPDAATRADLALQPGTPPELLYYLADDDDPLVRRAVAYRAETPVQAAPRLARDSDTDVRVLLSRKLARVLPHLTGPEHAAIRDLAQHALTMLAADQVVRVRAALAGALRDVAVAPPALVGQLARDVARDVAEPILRGCVNLPDEELLAIIAAQPVPWVLEAIARRDHVSSPVADAVAASGDPVATASLLANPGAAIGDGTMTRLVAKPLAVFDSGRAAAKPLLPPSLLGKLAGIVEDSIRGELAGQGFDKLDRQEVVEVTRRRLDWARDYVKREAPDAKAARLKAEGKLDENAVWDALSWGDKPFVREALALRADLPPDLVQRIIDTQSARAITALAWRAGLSMRCARLLQLKSGLPPTKLLNARHGIDYPMTEAEMRWQLGLFGVE
ncbi:DUF2336 domain-containing protein [Niveispirillum fermenti]|uniref:DUF2336 domain-containing protein n=1 Tax=Niveispirillum fermenti TaxID=1233113 RepID=UPI003A8C3F0A